MYKITEVAKVSPLIIPTFNQGLRMVVVGAVQVEIQRADGTAKKIGVATQKDLEELFKRGYTDYIEKEDETPNTIKKSNSRRGKGPVED